MGRSHLIKSHCALLTIPAFVSVKEGSTATANFTNIKAKTCGLNLDMASHSHCNAKCIDPMTNAPSRFTGMKQNSALSPRRDNAAISLLLDRGEQLQAAIDKLDESENRWKRMMVAVRVG